MGEANLGRAKVSLPNNGNDEYAKEAWNTVSSRLVSKSDLLGQIWGGRAECLSKCAGSYSHKLTSCLDTADRRSRCCWAHAIEWECNTE